MSKRKITEQEYLIEQIFNDIRYNNGEQIDEGWFDSLKANVAAGWNGLKQGVKNTGRRVADAGRTVKQVGKNIGQGVKAAGNLAIGNKEAAMQNVGNVKKAETKGISNTVSNAASTAKINSFSKSILNTVGSYIKAGGNVQELIGAIQELGAANQQADNTQDSEVKLPPLMTEPIPDDEKSRPIVAKQNTNQGQPQAPKLTGTTSQVPAASKAPAAQTAQQGINNGDNTPDPYAGYEPNAPDWMRNSVENEEIVNSSYDPCINSRGQKIMLNLLK